MDPSIIGLIIIVVIIWAIISLIGGSTYRCNKCGFRTSSRLEAAGHEKLENTHKCE